MATKALSFLHKNCDLDMTSGSINKKLLLFALPLLIGNLFQQFYNMVDTWVIGQTGINEAYAAVGSVGPIINILIGLFSGLASGAGVVISQHFGAKDTAGVKKAVHSSMLMTLCLIVAFTLLGVLLTPWILRLMLANEGELGAVYPHAKTYLIIYFSGVGGLMLYNMGAGILRAVGDSVRPLLFLIVCAAANTVLDLLFVNVFSMGVAGVALATVIGQLLSAAMVLFVLFRTTSCVKLELSALRFDAQMLKEIIRIGIPSALQMALTALSNVFVQSYIGGANGAQEICLGAWTSYTKIDQFIFLPVQSLALSVSTFVGQNLGSGNVDRAKRGTRTAFFMSLFCTALIILPVMLFAPFWASVFNRDAAVVAQATRLLRGITPFYLCCSVNQIFAASLRGAGNSRAPMIIMLTCFIGIRQIYLFTMSHYISNELLHIGLGYPLGWFCCAVTMLLYYLHFDFSRVAVVKKAQAGA